MQNQMGFWPFSSSEDSNKELGLSLLQSYFDEARNFSEFPYNDFSGWVSELNSKIPDFDVLLGELVKSNYASTTEGQAHNRVIDLANQSSGQATPQEIVGAAGGRGDSVNWLGGIPEIAMDTVSDAVSQTSEAFQNVGTGVFGTLNIMKYLPWILIGGGALFIWSNGSSLAKTFEKAKKYVG